MVSFKERNAERNFSLKAIPKKSSFLEQRLVKMLIKNILIDYLVFSRHHIIIIIIYHQQKILPSRSKCLKSLKIYIIFYIIFKVFHENLTNLITFV